MSAHYGRSREEVGDSTHRIHHTPQAISPARLLENARRLPRSPQRRLAINAPVAQHIISNEKKKKKKKEPR